ncbi:septal ring lytic transglycosylase RlpA family protein [Oceanithermus sp.]
MRGFAALSLLLLLAACAPRQTAPVEVQTQRVYTVQSGDTLYSISRRFGVSVAALQAANDLEGTLLRAGQRLIIPGGATPEYWNPVGYVEEGMASWYGPGFHGRPTASGEVFDMYALTAAHRTLPFGSIVRVLRLDTGDAVTVRINDRGPFKKDRIIDLSYAAARKIGLDHDGTARVRIEVVGYEP